MKEATMANTSAESADRDAILAAIQAWPRGAQVLLVQLILERAQAADRVTTPTVRPSAEPPARPSQGAAQRSTWDALYGIASGGQQPPSDEQVAKWLDDQKREKDGR